MFRRILITAWASIFGSVVLLGLFPRLVTRVPRPGFLFVFLLACMLISLLYGIFSLYRHGMKRAKPNSPDGTGDHRDTCR